MKTINPKLYEFEAKIIKVPDMDAAYVEFPYDVLEEFAKKRVFVKASFDGYPYYGSLVRMGTTNHIIGIKKEIRKIIKKEAGDIVKVSLKERYKDELS